LRGLRTDAARCIQVWESVEGARRAALAELEQIQTAIADHDKECAARATTLEAEIATVAELEVAIAKAAGEVERARAARRDGVARADNAARQSEALRTELFRLTGRMLPPYHS
jgi:chromosome segregation ATPase